MYKPIYRDEPQANRVFDFFKRMDPKQIQELSYAVVGLLGTTWFYCYATGQSIVEVIVKWLLLPL